MAATYTQAKRPLSVDTPLGKDKLLLIGFRGMDALSQLFRYRCDMIAKNDTEVAFDKLLGQPCTVTFRWGKDNAKERYFNGICTRISQGERDAVFTRYHMELMPKAWLLTRKAQSKIFQRLPVPDILKKVLTGFDVKWNIQGTFYPRDFCVQYRETDFNFACRLMEEEGIYYYFMHANGNHTMVVANTPSSHEAVPVQNSVPYEEKLGGPRDELRISSWEKVQQLRAGKYTLWDHSFELPHKHLEAEKTIQEAVSVGSVSHKLKVADNTKLEIYDFPGEYAQRFDGIDKGGGDQSAELQKIFEDNKRTVEIRMQQEAVESLEIEGKGDCRQFASGHKFTLQRHFSADGDYVLTSVQHVMTTSSTDYQSGQGQTSYLNSFTCIPFALPFRPSRVTPKPVVQGTQSAVVVGPPGEEIFTDKYGRVKVQFHWDREGKMDPDSSCWIRVATLWAGKQWGMIHIPRTGQEVLVDFLEGDPDQPVIVGSVYNADMMPPYTLPANKTQSGGAAHDPCRAKPEHLGRGGRESLGRARPDKVGRARREDDDRTRPEGDRGPRRAHHDPEQSDRGGRWQRVLLGDPRTNSLGGGL
jgi:type VI secretion system secreted protein VgrG